MSDELIIKKKNKQNPQSSENSRSPAPPTSPLPSHHSYPTPSPSLLPLAASFSPTLLLLFFFFFFFFFFFTLSINNNNNSSNDDDLIPITHHMMSSLIERPPNWIGPPHHHPFPCTGCGRPHLPLPPFHRPTPLRLKPSFLLAHHRTPLLPFHLFGHLLFPLPTCPDASEDAGRRKGRVWPNSSCGQDRDSGEKREAKSGGESKPPPANPPNRGKGR